MNFLMVEPCVWSAIRRQIPTLIKQLENTESWYNTYSPHSSSCKQRIDSLGFLFRQSQDSLSQTNTRFQNSLAERTTLLVIRRTVGVIN